MYSNIKGELKDRNLIKKGEIKMPTNEIDCLVCGKDFKAVISGNEEGSSGPGPPYSFRASPGVA